MSCDVQACVFPSILRISPTLPRGAAIRVTPGAARRHGVTRTYFRILASIALCIAIVALRTELSVRSPATGRGALALAQAYGGQGFANPGTGDPSETNGIGMNAMGGPGGTGGVNPYMMNNYGVSSPTTPTSPVRPKSWPGGSEDPDAPNRPDAKTAAAYQEAPKRALSDPPYDPAEIVARVGSESIQATELLPGINQHISKLKVQYADQFSQLPPELREVELNKIRRQAMEHSVKDMVSLKLVLCELRQTVPAEALKKHDKEVRDFFNNTVIKQLMVDYKATNVGDLENKLREAGSSLNTQRMVFVEQQLVMSWMKQQVKDEKEPTHEQMLEYYREHHVDWETPARARWEQLSVQFAKFPSKAAAWQALARWGNQVLGGAPFGDVARANSQDFAAEERGLHDWTSQGSLRSTALDQAVFELPVGGLSPIIEDEEGLHIVRVVERQDGKRTPFSEVQPEIKKRMHDGTQHRQRQEYLTKLRQRTPIWTIFDETPSPPVIVANSGATGMPPPATTETPPPTAAQPGATITR